MSSNIIGPLPKKSVAQSEKIEKSSGDFDDIEEPVIKIRQKYLDNEKDKRIPINHTSGRNLQ